MFCSCPQTKTFVVAIVTASWVWCLVGSQHARLHWQTSHQNWWSHCFPPCSRTPVQPPRAQPLGEVRGIVVGDVVRRLVAKTMAKQFMTKFEAATKPFQHALATRAGSESIAHAMQVVTDMDPRATVLSIDGVGAFDLISRHASWRENPSIRPPISRTPFHTFVGRRGRGCPRDSTRQRRRTRRPLDAGFVRPGSTSSPGSNPGVSPAIRDVDGLP